MMRNKSSSGLQKTYDECYLICSTAVYFEGQGNEAEALRSWRSALDQIYYHNAYRVPAGYIPKSETEKALKDSLRDMEMQCKERVDLLEALKASRQEKLASESSTEEHSAGKITKSSKQPTPRVSEERQREGMKEGYIGNGTIPAVSYDGISKPPPLPQRPSLAAKNSSERAVVGKKIGSSSYLGSGSSSRNASAPSAPSSSSTLAPPMKKSSRSPSPEKGRQMLHTLRSSDKSGRKPSPRPLRTARRENPVTNRAATLAWQSTQQRDRLGTGLDRGLDLSSTTLPDGARKESISDPSSGRPSSSNNVRYDKDTRTLVSHSHPKTPSPTELLSGIAGSSNHYPFPPTDPGQPGAGFGSMPNPTFVQDLIDLDIPISNPSETSASRSKKTPPLVPPHATVPSKLEPLSYPTYLKEYPETAAKKSKAGSEMPERRKPPVRAPGETDGDVKLLRRPFAGTKPASPRHRDRHQERDDARRAQRKGAKPIHDEDTSSQSPDDSTNSGGGRASKGKRRQKQREDPILAGPATPTSGDSEEEEDPAKTAWEQKVAHLLKNLPKGVDEGAAKQIFNEIVVQGDEVHWGDVAGLDIAKNALKEAVVYPFLRPDLFMGLREPARGMLLFGPPGTGKTMLARAVATESRSTFFSISASSLTSKYLGESEKLVRALFSLAKALAPSIIFVDEIDSLLSSRSGSGENEATRRIKTEFLIQWSDLQRAAAGREQTEKEKKEGDASRVLVLAATNLPWAIDEAARRRFVRRQYIPLPEDETRAVQLKTLLGHQKHSLKDEDIQRLVSLTNGFSGSDITALAKDAAMGPLRSLGEALLHMSMDQIRPIGTQDFEASLVNIRPSVSKQGLKEFEDWAKEFGERGG
ncbi:AAA family ATPase-like protein [Amylocarpus encephaloides]|uniref:AAA family ATPase-like protein n=1 Tax=Amylocarpus encephaloides TaxID=45428 RepID=A0A9P8C3Q3_9HELO|nr:AAA family ATPase-like protein [Amylocarpus encephaloides]